MAHAQQAFGLALLVDRGCPADELLRGQRAQRGQVGQQVVHLTIVHVALQNALPGGLQMQLQGLSVHQ